MIKFSQLSQCDRIQLCLRFYLDGSMSGVNWSAVVWLDVNKPDTLPKSVENSAFEAFCIMKSGHFVRKIMTYLKLFSVMSWVRY